MCDTVYCKRDGRSFFGKNSDRSPNEAHLMIRCPAADHAAGETVRATYVSLPQAEHTHACVLLKPVWTWGAEMGWNAFGLAVGNEAVFNRRGYERREGLLGMDLVRLALERCTTAKQAAECIVSLLVRYGQGGNCAFDKTFRYDNAFLLADPGEAWILETAGREWVLSRAADVQAISNCMHARADYAQSSLAPGTDYKRTFENRLFTAVAGAERRKRQASEIVGGEGDVCERFYRALTSHASDRVTCNRSSTASVCMHAGNAFGDHTTGSFFGELGACYFVTGASFPCLSLYKPVAPSASVLPEDEKTALAYWLRRERLHRHIMSGNIDTAAYFRRRAELQRSFFEAARKARGEALERASRLCFDMEKQFVDEWLNAAGGKPFRIRGGPYFRAYWQKKTRALEHLYE